MSFTVQKDVEEEKMDPNKKMNHRRNANAFMSKLN